MDEMEKIFINELIKPLERKIKKLYVNKYKHKILWNKRKQNKLNNLENKYMNYIYFLENRFLLKK